MHSVAAAHSVALHDEGARRDFIQIAASAAAVGAAGAAFWPIDQTNRSSDTLALASIEVDYSKAPLGQQITVKWRGKPIFIWRRKPAEIAAAVDADHADLRDPATDESRHKPGKADWLSGRIRSGPAPKTLYMPEYAFESGSVVRIG